MARPRRTPERPRPSSASFADGELVRVAAYPRVSSDGQTIESQIPELVRFVAARKWTLARPPETYVDDAITGASGLERRDGIRRLLEDAGRGEFQIVVVCGIDRLTRSDDWIERAAVVGGLQRAGVLIADVQTGAVHDLSTEQGDLFVGLGAFFAAAERRKIAERTSRGKRHALAQGRKHQSIDPYGLRYDRDAGRFVEREAEADVVRAIYRLVLDGLSCLDVARELNARGAPIRDRANRALAWSRDRVHKIARSSTYRGEYVVDRASGLALPVPVIVDERTWHEVQARLGARRRAGPGPRSSYSDLAAGVARCALCGGPVGITWGGSSRGPARYYACRARVRPEQFGRSCELRYWRTSELDALLWSEIEGVLAGGPGADRLLAELRAADERDPDEDARALERAEARLAQLGRAQAAALAQHRRGLVDEDVLEVELRAIAAEREDATATVAHLRAAAEARWSPEDLASAVDAIQARLAGCSPEQRRDLVRALVPGHGRYVVTVGQDSISAVLCLDPRAWICQASRSSGRTPRTTYPPPLDVAVRAAA